MPRANVPVRMSRELASKFLDAWSPVSAPYSYVEPGHVAGMLRHGKLTEEDLGRLVKSLMERSDRMGRR